MAKHQENAEMKEQKTPGELGYRMPAEWEAHAGTWLGWPHELTDWPGKFAPIPWAFAEIVRHLSRVERVYLLLESRAAEKRVRGILKKAGANLEAVDFFVVPTDRGWMRTGRTWGNTGKCIYRMIRCTTRSSISRLVIWDF